MQTVAFGMCRPDKTLGGEEPSLRPPCRRSLSHERPPSCGPPHSFSFTGMYRQTTASMLPVSAIQTTLTAEGTRAM